MLVVERFREAVLQGSSSWKFYIALVSEIFCGDEPMSRGPLLSIVLYDNGRVAFLSTACHLHTTFPDECRDFPSTTLAMKRDILLLVFFRWLWRLSERFTTSYERFPYDLELEQISTNLYHHKTSVEYARVRLVLQRYCISPHPLPYSFYPWKITKSAINQVAVNGLLQKHSEGSCV